VKSLAPTDFSHTQIINDELVKLRLKASHPYAEAMSYALRHLWQMRSR